MMNVETVTAEEVFDRGDLLCQPPPPYIVDKATVVLEHHELLAIMVIRRFESTGPVFHNHLYAVTLIGSLVV